MFQDIAEPSTRVGSRKASVLPLSIAVHVVIVVSALLLPLLAPGVLPNPAVAAITYVKRDVVLAPDPPQPPRRIVAATTHPVTTAAAVAAPLEAPSAIGPETTVDRVLAPIGTIDGPGSIGDGLGVEAALAPARPPPAAATPEGPIRIGGKIEVPTKIKDVKPVYPAIAQAARVDGVVIIETTIGPTGTVLEATLLRSIPLLDSAALEAVRQWEFTPTLLNGVPISVVMVVTVRFSLK
jgi:protein TonB